jgi:hypothetical protein
VNNSEFDKQLEFGGLGEKRVRNWITKHLRKTVIPISDRGPENGRGPRVFNSEGSTVSPDFMVIDAKGQTEFNEIKTKTRFTYYRALSRYETGIDKKYFEEYYTLQLGQPIPVWLIFLHLDNEPSVGDLSYGAPRPCPTGLFGNTIANLYPLKREGGHTTRGGKFEPMCYWGKHDLVQLATFEEVLLANGEYQALAKLVNKR